MRKISTRFSDESREGVELFPLGHAALAIVSFTSSLVVVMRVHRMRSAHAHKPERGRYGIGQRAGHGRPHRIAQADGVAVRRTAVAAAGASATRTAAPAAMEVARCGRLDRGHFSTIYTSTMSSAFGPVIASPASGTLFAFAPGTDDDLLTSVDVFDAVLDASDHDLIAVHAWDDADGCPMLAAVTCCGTVEDATVNSRIHVVRIGADAAVLTKTMSCVPFFVGHLPSELFGGTGHPRLVVAGSDRKLHVFDARRDDIVDDAADRSAFPSVFQNQQASIMSMDVVRRPDGSFAVAAGYQDGTVIVSGAGPGPGPHTPWAYCADGPIPDLRLVELDGILSVVVVGAIGFVHYHHAVVQEGLQADSLVVLPASNTSDCLTSVAVDSPSRRVLVGSYLQEILVYNVAPASDHRMPDIALTTRIRVADPVYRILLPHPDDKTCDLIVFTMKGIYRLRSRQ